MIYFDNGDLLDCNCQYICHQVNCQGKMNSGVAKAIREKWPFVFKCYLDILNDTKHQMLGGIQAVNTQDNKVIINMFAQNGYGYDGKRYTSYDAFWSCLGEIKQTVPQGSSIAFPDHIGCCRGGANWDVILSMIDAVLGEDYEVHIYRLEENENDK
jgi:O-acetyl-ADP-ribose deacetylase (regulator of RNase III)